MAGEQLPEEFALAGWRPEPWAPEDLLNRTDGFLASHGADDELFLARLGGVVGLAEAARLLGTPGGSPASAVDLAAINYFVANVLRRVGTAPFFLGLFGPVPGVLAEARPAVEKPLPLSVAPISGVAIALGSSRTETGEPLLAGALPGTLEAPSTTYLVHLQAPGWNVIGATAPWRPGVSVGHNERVAWTFTPSALDVEDIVVERVNPANPRQVAVAGRGWRDITVVQESVVVKGRRESYDFEKQLTPHGVVIAVDRERHLAYTLRWSGAAPGAATELAALSVARAQSWPEFRAALARWRLPVAEFVYADSDRHIGWQTAGAVPERRGGTGVVPLAGWAGEGEWRGWAAPRTLPGILDPKDGAVVVVDSEARRSRLAERLRAGPVNLEAAWRALRDTQAWNAGQLVPLLIPLRATDPVVERARQRLLAWNREISRESPEALLYVIWEHALKRGLGSLRIPSSLLDDFAPRAGALLVPALTTPSTVWFNDGIPGRNALLIDALVAAVDDERRWTASEAGADLPWGRFQTLGFRHPLAISPEARRRYDTGGFAMPGYHETVLATARAGERSVGPVLEFVFDVGSWDASRVLTAPGQSGAADSPHFDDLTSRWRDGEGVPLPFSDAAIAAAAESRLTLSPP
jgi:penicillin amidase